MGQLDPGEARFWEDLAMNAKARVLSLASGILLAAAAAVAPAAAEDAVNLGKAFGGSFYFAMADVGQAAGIFEKHGLKVTISAFGGGAKLQQAMAAGSIDVGLSTGTDMALTLNGAPMKAVGVGFVGAAQVAIVAKDSKFQSAADLKGSRWPVAARASISGYLPVALALQQGWTVDDVVLNPGIPPDQAMALIKTGQLDAMTMDPTVAMGLEAKGEMRTLLDFNDVLTNFLMYAVYATDDFQAQHPDTLKKFMAAWYETIKYAQDHKDETVKAIAAATNVDPEFVAKTYDQQVPKYSTTGRFDPAVIDYMKQAFVTATFVDTPPDLSKAYTEAFLP
jgi:NitT/TauT family transport system substrate-binding protein